jgi:hypothetical protein
MNGLTQDGLAEARLKGTGQNRVYRAAEKLFEVACRSM